MESTHNEDSIRTLDWKDHIRMRPGMYIGTLGDGSSFGYGICKYWGQKRCFNDGIYKLLKEILDNSIDEFVMGAGKKIMVNISSDGRCEVRDFGSGIPLGKLFECASQINTGAKYDSEAFKKSVGLNGVGIKAVNALSGFFEIQSYRDGKTLTYEFSEGVEKSKKGRSESTSEPNGTRVAFKFDETIFPPGTNFRLEFVEKMCRYYSYLNAGLTIILNGHRFISPNGLFDMLEETMSDAPRYPIIHLAGADIEVAFTYGGEKGKKYSSFVNGWQTIRGGTHEEAFRKAIVKTLRYFYPRKHCASDILSAIVAAVSIKVTEPVFESQTKTKLGSNTISPDGETICSFMENFIGRELKNYLHKNPEVAEILGNKIKDSQRDRKESSRSSIKRLAKWRAPKE